ncbi:MAG: glycerophosphodiester phosphodiesterase [Sporichthyaceae bacterium]
MLLAAAAAVGLSATLGAAPARAAGLEKVQIIGHRGGNDFGPEHAMSTMKHSIDVGADAIEIDIRFTSDNVPVLMHDWTLDRTTDCTGPVNAVTLADLHSQCRLDGVPEDVATLEQALELLAPSPMHIYLHVKQTNRDDQLRILVQTMEKYGINDGEKATTMGDNEKLLARLQAAGSQRLGLVFNQPGGWSANYPVLIAYNTPLPREQVLAAQRRGILVLAVQDHLLTLPGLLDGVSGIDGYMANHLDATLQHLGRFKSPDGSAPVRPRSLSPNAPPSDHFPMTGLDGA